MIADIDVASIITALQSGASWGYRMVFIMLALTVPLFLIQDAAGRLGTASGLGLGEAIRKHFGKRTALIASIPMSVSDFLEYVAEYAGIAIGLKLLGMPVVIGLLAVFAFHTMVVVGRKYKDAEIVLIPVSFVLVAAIVASAFVFHFSIGQFLSLGLSPIQPYGNPSFDFLLAASMGAVIMPWMLYFHSGADSRRKKEPKDLKNESIETLLGAVVSEVLMALIVVVGLHLANGSGLINLATLSKAIAFFGPYASLLMGIGFVFAGFLALVVISLGSAWGVLEALGRNSKSSFLAVYMTESIPALVLVLFITSYIQLVLSLMVVYTIIIIPSLYFLGRLVSDEKVMKGYPLGRLEGRLFWLASISIVIGGILGILALI
jgi:NRAMP (natural resistance-associated macrophage protein)-like metal ion transporter